MEGGINLYVYALNNPILLVDPYGLLTQAYHDATGGGWASPPPIYNHRANQLIKIPDSTLDATIKGASIMAVASHQLKNPTGIAVFTGIATAAQSLKYQKKEYNLIDLTSDIIKFRAPPNKSFFLNDVIDNVVSGKWDGNTIMWLMLNTIDKTVDLTRQINPENNTKCN